MNQDFIEIVGARENNLKNISLRIPKRKITIFTGVSGSGKSSVVFDTIAQEAGRQLNETYPNFTRLFLPRYSQPDADAINNLATAIVVDQKRLGGNARSTLGTITDINSLLRLLFSRFAVPYLGYGNQYSFNEPAGMCETCEGIGRTVAMNLETALDMDKSLNEGAILLPGYGVGTWYWKSYSESGFFDNDKKICDYSEEEFNKLVYAKAEKVVVNYRNSDFNTTYEGLSEKYARQNIKTSKEQGEAAKSKLEKFSTVCVCRDCGGKRYNPETLSSKINGYSIYDLTALQIDELTQIMRGFTDENAAPIVYRIIERLQSLVDIGLDYMTLERETSTLSGGESQRVKIVKHLSSSLTDVMYIFDEPSIGLHARDVHRLNELLISLRDKGNTVIVVEHDTDVIKIADYIVDMGPLAGKDGGEIVFEGTYDGLITSGTLTGQCLGKKTEINRNPRKAAEFLECEPSSLHNLKNVSLRVPKGLFTVVTGVAGSGKSTLVNEVFAPQYPDTVRIDQSAVPGNIRSNPATYSGIMDYIRSCFATENKVSAGLFSYNSEGGCETCKGTGIVELNLSFMDTKESVCGDCEGRRYKDEVLKYLYKGKNISEVMNMTVAEALDFFDDKDIGKKLKNIVEVGLFYMTLGQPLNTLSGGECQRLKLAKELGKKGNVYILDEPTTGLHMMNISSILEIIDKLVDKGNTVVVIEHNIDFIKNADYIIDMGPEGGSRGGQILFEGRPEDLLLCENSITAKYLI